MAKETDYTEQLGKDICLEIASGDSVAVACSKHDVGERTFYTWLTKHEDLKQNYTRARDVRSDAHFESSAALMQDLRNGLIQSDQARIMLDEIKWKCAKQSPKKYGDSTQVKLADHEGNKLSFAGILGAIDGRTSGLPSAPEETE